MNNEEKNTYVTEHIISATLELLKEHELSALSIGQITSAAGVSRNAFYRNYQEKEDIVRAYIRKLYLGWWNEYLKTATGLNSDLYGSLFGHLYANRDFYLLLKKRGLFHLFRQVMMTESGPKPEQENLAAYTVAFVIQGSLGWIEEWLNRGMQESGEVMAAMLAANENK